MQLPCDHLGAARAQTIVLRRNTSWCRPDGNEQNRSIILSRLFLGRTDSRKAIKIKRKDKNTPARSGYGDNRQKAKRAPVRPKDQAVSASSTRTRPPPQPQHDWLRVLLCFFSPFPVSVIRRRRHRFSRSGSSDIHHPVFQLSIPSV